MSYYDEYYCPNCGAILNDQAGFDPEAGTWTCIECNQLLMDKDIYDGDKFEGVAWFCDECGALLNKQPGFSDVCGSWVCTECGYYNEITEDNIISNPGFTCPNCGAALDNQLCFNKYEDDWQCTECDAYLHRDYSDDDYEVVKNRCPDCGANLDKQPCYFEYEDDWQCTECGAKLHRDDSDEEYEKIDNNDDSSDKFYGTSKPDYAQVFKRSNLYRQSAEPSYDCQAPETDCSESAVISIIKSHWKSLLALFMIFIIVIVSIGIFHELKLRIPVRYSSEELIGKDFEQVVNCLETSGFTNVYVKEIPDLTIEQKPYENLVSNVEIGNVETFDASSEFSSNSIVLVTYHTLQQFAAPLSAKAAKGQSYIDVANQFGEAGFVNIRFEVEYDIITGWLTDDGEVKSVSVNGDDKFSSGALYKADAEIVITYHTWKKNKEKN
ncbi:MAG: hypothetical protein KBS52_06185 [Clostridiales bacterium]|nr:hypothetical protein [Candidatus Equinaster intestinalis]